MFKTQTTTIHWEREDPRLYQRSVEVTNMCSVSNHHMCDQIDDHSLSTPSPTPTLALSPLRSAKGSSYKPHTFEELDSIWKLCDAIYASPAPEDLPPIDFWTFRFSELCGKRWNSNGAVTFLVLLFLSTLWLFNYILLSPCRDSEQCLFRIPDEGDALALL